MVTGYIVGVLLVLLVTAAYGIKFVPARDYKLPYRTVYHIEEDVSNSEQLIVSTYTALHSLQGEELEIIVGSDSKPAGYNEGVGEDARFNLISSFHQVNTTHIIVVDHLNNCLRLVNRETASTSPFAGVRNKNGDLKNGNSTEAMFNNPRNLISGYYQNEYYLTDAANNAIRLIGVSSDHQLVRVSTPIRGDELIKPSGLSLDRKNHRLLVATQHSLVIIDIFTNKITSSFSLNKPEFLDVISLTPDVFLITNGTEIRLLHITAHNNRTVDNLTSSRSCNDDEPNKPYCLHLTRNRTKLIIGRKCSVQFVNVSGLGPEQEFNRTKRLIAPSLGGGSIIEKEVTDKSQIAPTTLAPTNHSYIYLIVFVLAGVVVVTGFAFFATAWRRKQRNIPNANHMELLPIRTPSLPENIHNPDEQLNLPTRLPILPSDTQSSSDPLYARISSAGSSRLHHGSPPLPLRLDSKPTRKPITSPTIEHNANDTYNSDNNDDIPQRLMMEAKAYCPKLQPLKCTPMHFKALPENVRNLSGYEKPVAANRPTGEQFNLPTRSPILPSNTQSSSDPLYERISPDGSSRLHHGSPPLPLRLDSKPTRKPITSPTIEHNANDTSYNYDNNDNILQHFMMEAKTDCPKLHPRKCTPMHVEALSGYEKPVAANRPSSEQLNLPTRSTILPSNEQRKVPREPPRMYPRRKQTPPANAQCSASKYETVQYPNTNTQISSRPPERSPLLPPNSNANNVRKALLLSKAITNPKEAASSTYLYNINNKPLHPPILRLKTESPRVCSRMSTTSTNYSLNLDLPQQ